MVNDRHIETHPTNRRFGVKHEHTSPLLSTYHGLWFIHKLFTIYYPNQKLLLKKSISPKVELMRQYTQRNKKSQKVLSTYIFKKLIEMGSHSNNTRRQKYRFI